VGPRAGLDRWGKSRPPPGFGVVVNKQYNVMVDSEELIGTTECLTI
jgi:hypothetical protein